MAYARYVPLIGRWSAPMLSDCADFAAQIAAESMESDAKSRLSSENAQRVSNVHCVAG